MIKKLKKPLLKLNKEKKPFIEHFIIEVYGINPKILMKCKNTLPFVKKFIEKSKLKVVNQIHHNFKPFGNTMVFILANSHLAVHTWPENKFIHFDLLSCQELANPSELKHTIFEVFKTHNFKIRKEIY